MTPLRSACILLLVSRPAAPADWPQFRGPTRDGISPEGLDLGGWPEGGAPRALWRAQVGKGHSALSVRAGRGYTMGWDGKLDTVYCLDLATGGTVWKQSYACASIGQWPGPRSSPAVEEGAVYTLGQHGQLRAWRADDGTLLWSRDLPDALEPDVDYGFTWSPLLDGDFLILGTGKAGIAIDKRTGKTAWGDPGGRGACASPVPFRHAGGRGVALLALAPDRDSAWLIGIEARTGRELWRWGPWNERWGAVCNDLLVKDGKVFVTSSEQYLRCARFSIDGNTLREDWSSNKLAGYTGGCVVAGGGVYGVNKAGILKCLDWETGEERWHRRGFGSFGALIAAKDRLIIQASDGGDLSIVAASPRGFSEIRRARVLAEDAPETFTAPVLADGVIYCRSYAGEVVALRP